MYTGAVGAGPGPVKKYKVDMPFPWGDNTEVAVPVDQMVSDTWEALRPRLSEFENQIILDLEAEAQVFGPRIAAQILEQEVWPELDRTMEETMAEVEMLKDDVTKALVLTGASLLVGLGVGVWWLRRGR